MSTNIDLHDIVMQQAQVIAQLTAQLATSVGVTTPVAMVVTKDYDDTLTGSALVREYFRRGGGALHCYVDDISDESALKDRFARTVKGYDDARGRFISKSSWVYAVACDDDGVVLTEDQLLGGL